jgi:hypothetical protein
LLRGFAIDFITAHDLTAVSRIMAPDYCLSIGGHTLDGRDSQYLPPTAAQIEQFPGLCVTVHDVMYGEDAIAMQFTEHGRSSRHDFRGATWRGISLFRTDGERMRWGWAEEDYFARKSQLASGVCDAVDPPHATPWDVQPELPDAGVEEVARDWLRRPEKIADIPHAHWISKVDPLPEKLIDFNTVEKVEIDTLFSAANRVAFHLAYHGSYAGGFSDIDSGAVGEPTILRAAGMLTIRRGEVVDARITTDRLGFYRSLLKSRK